MAEIIVYTFEDADSRPLGYSTTDHREALSYARRQRAQWFMCVCKIERRQRVADYTSYTGPHIVPDAEAEQEER